MQHDLNTPQEPKHGFIKTLIAAMICAAFIRSFFFEPFHIPSSSMKPNLLIGDYIFVSKFSYGYSRYSFPFGFNIFEGRTGNQRPERGDVAVFRLPSNPSINYVKRVIGLPGDTIQMRQGVLYINNKQVAKVSHGVFEDEHGPGFIEINKFLETLPEGKTIETLDQRVSDADDTGIYTVPKGHYFMMGDNRDNSQDSRFQNLVGYVPEDHLVGKALYVFFSSKQGLWKFWKWNDAIRFNRVLTKIN